MALKRLFKLYPASESLMSGCDWDVHWHPSWQRKKSWLLRFNGIRNQMPRPVVARRWVVTACKDKQLVDVQTLNLSLLIMLLACIYSHLRLNRKTFKTVLPFYVCTLSMLCLLRVWSNRQLTTGRLLSAGEKCLLRSVRAGIQNISGQIQR